MKKFIIQAILLVIVILGAIYVYKGQTVSFAPQKPKFEKLVVAQTKINVEIADTKEKRSQGLGGRQSLATDSGMLFIFPKEDFYSFWMKGLKFPLDFIWIRGDKVVGITENVSVPPEGSKDADLPIYQSKERIDKALEVNAGFVKTNNTKAGDTVTIQR